MKMVPELLRGTSQVMEQRRKRVAAIGQMLIVVLIWSTSFVGVKVALRYTGPLTIAALRYFLAFLFLLPWLLVRRREFPHLPRAQWLRFSLMGIAQYTIGNGVLYIAMKTLSATTGSLVLCLLPIGELAPPVRPRSDHRGRIPLLFTGVGAGRAVGAVLARHFGSLCVCFSGAGAGSGKR